MMTDQWSGERFGRRDTIVEWYWYAHKNSPIVSYGEHWYVAWKNYVVYPNGKSK